MMNDIQHVAADPLDGISQALDRAAAVGIAHLTHGLSPVTMILAATDWALHLACAPGKQLQLGAKAARKYWRLSDYIGRSLSDPGSAPAIEPLRQDRRFTDPAWKEPPFNLIVQAFLLNQPWWHAATTGKIGRAANRDRLGLYVYSVVGVGKFNNQ